MLAAPVEVGDTIGEGIDAFGFHENSRSEKRELYVVTVSGAVFGADVLTSAIPLTEAANMPELLFYERVVALSDQLHAGLRVRPAAGFSYAAATNSVPLLGSEFFDCAREYPIVFVRGESGPLPVALLGLRDRENLFVDGSGKWDARYIPAFVRRYPFVPATGPAGDLLVCIDEASPCFSLTDGEALFADGKPTPKLEHAIKFLREFHQIAAGTELLGRRLDELGLLRQADSLARLNDGSQYRLNGLSVVDEDKLRALSKKAVQELFANGGLGAIHAHIISLGNLSGLADRLGRRGPAKKPE